MGFAKLAAANTAISIINLRLKPSDPMSHHHNDHIVTFIVCDLVTVVIGVHEGRGVKCRAMT